MKEQKKQKKLNQNFRFYRWVPEKLQQLDKSRPKPKEMKLKTVQTIKPEKSKIIDFLPNYEK